MHFMLLLLGVESPPSHDHGIAQRLAAPSCTPATESPETSVLVLCTLSVSFLLMCHFYFAWLQSLVTPCSSF